MRALKVLGVTALIVALTALWNFLWAYVPFWDAITTFTALVGAPIGLMVWLYKELGK